MLSYTLCISNSNILTNLCPCTLDTCTSCPCTLDTLFLLPVKTQHSAGENIGLLHCRRILYHLSHHGSLTLNETLPKVVSGDALRSVPLKLGCTADSSGLFEKKHSCLCPYIAQKFSLISMGLIKLVRGFLKRPTSRYYRWASFPHTSPRCLILR